MKKNKRMPFTAYLIVVTFISTLEFSAFNFYPYRPYFLAMALLFLVIHIGINMKELANNWIRIALFLSAGISYLMTGETVFSLLLITVSTTPDREYVYYFKIMVTTQIILTVISIVLAVCGIIPNICIERDRGWGLEQRYALGFGHPNNFANQTFSILLLLICINKDKFTYKKLIVAILIICGNFYLTRSRTVLILSVFIISAICFGKKYKKIQEIFYKVVNWVLPMAFSLSIILPYIIYDIPEN